MKTTALKEETLKEEAINLFNRMSTQKMYTVIQFARFIAQQPEAELEARNKRDIEIINENAEYLNAGAEENLEFQADIWENED